VEGVNVEDALAGDDRMLEPQMSEACVPRSGQMSGRTGEANVYELTKLTSICWDSWTQ